MAKKLKKYKVGCDSETYAISLVEEPAIESDFVALSKDEEEKQQVFLESNEKHLVVGAALIPDKDIYRNNGEQEFYINFTKESIEKMSQEFMKEYRQKEVTLDHEDAANEICVVESWIVLDSYKDKSNALGINVPEGTWMVSMKVNNIETWERIKSGELKGFSVESLISLEDFSKDKNDNNMNIETNDMNFWTKMKEVLSEVFSSEKTEEPIELEEQVPTEPTVEPQEPTVTEPIAEPQEPQQEPQPSTEPQEPQNEPTEPQNEPQPIEEPKDNHLEDLIASLKDEITALKEMNNGLNDKLKELSRQPSTQPINTNAKPNAGDTYASWREQMAKYIG